MSMDNYIIGVIEVIPMEILEEGLRKELLITLGGKLNEKLRFKDVKNFSEFEQILSNLGEELDSIKKALEYIQDMLNIYGLKIWYDEYNKLISSYIDVEWNFIRSKELPDEALKWAASEIQPTEEKAKVVTRHLKVSENSLTFIGRTINALINLCRPDKTDYVRKTLSFYDSESKNVLVTMNTFLRLRNCLGVNGLAGIDKLLSFMIVSEHYVVQKELKKIVKSDKLNLKNESESFGMLNKVVNDIDKIYDGAKKRLKPRLDSIITALEKIGLYTILREMTLRELNLSSKSDS